MVELCHEEKEREKERESHVSLRARRSEKRKVARGIRRLRFAKTEARFEWKDEMEANCFAIDSNRIFLRRIATDEINAETATKGTNHGVYIYIWSPFFFVSRKLKIGISVNKKI